MKEILLLLQIFETKKNDVKNRTLASEYRNICETCLSLRFKLDPNKTKHDKTKGNYSLNVMLVFFFFKVLDCRLHSRSTLGQFLNTKIDSEKRCLIIFYCRDHWKNDCVFSIFDETLMWKELTFEKHQKSDFFQGLPIHWEHT